jgi:hypothetical protein
MKQSGIEPATFLFVAQCLNQLRQPPCAPKSDHWTYNLFFVTDFLTVLLKIRQIAAQRPPMEQQSSYPSEPTMHCFQLSVGTYHALFIFST